MSFTTLRAYAHQILLFVGLVMVVGGGAGLTVGYIGWKDARNRAMSMAVATTPTTTKSAVAKKPATKPAAAKPGARMTAGSQKSRTVASAAKKPVAAAASAKSLVAKAGPDRTARWARTMGWSSGFLIVGVVLVGIGIHERPPTRPTSGADEMLNEPCPF